MILFLYFKTTLQTLLFLLASLTLSLQIDCLPSLSSPFSHSIYIFPLIVPSLHHFSLFIFHLAALPYFLSTGLSSLSLLFPPLSLPPPLFVNFDLFPFHLFSSLTVFFFSGVHLLSFTFSFFSFFLYSSLPFQYPQSFLPLQIFVPSSSSSLPFKRKFLPYQNPFLSWLWPSG